MASVQRVIILLGCLYIAFAACAAPNSVALHYQVINGFPVKYVTVDMKDPDVVVTTALATPFPTGLEPWNSFLARLQPDAAINGTYFCLRSFMPVGDVAVNGNLLYRGVVGTALCIAPDNRVAMRPGPRQARPDWSGFNTVLCAGPRLLTRSEITINARAEGFRDPRVLGSAPRSAVAWRPDGVLILLTIEQNISLRNLAYVCLHLGAVDAMALDGGNSSGLYADGRTVTRPGRGLSNILVVYTTPERYQMAATQLAPPALPIIASLLPRTPSPPATRLPLPGWTTPPTIGEALRLDNPFADPAVASLRPNASLAPVSSLVRFVTPDPTLSIRGTVPIKVEIARESRTEWVSLRINGQLRVLSNVCPLEYAWDTTKETDGQHTLEVTIWSPDRAPLGRDIRQVKVKNGEQVASK